MAGNGVAWHAPSTSARLLPAGRCAACEAAAGGMGMTSEQSTSVRTSCPRTAILAIAAVNLVAIEDWSAGGVWVGG